MGKINKDNQTKEKTNKQHELNGDLAKAALTFLDRTNISGSEAHTMLVIKDAIARLV